MNSFHGNLSRCRRQRSKKTKQTIGVSPEVILNVNGRTLAVIGHEYLSRNRNYIRPNRTALLSYLQKLVILKHQNGDYPTKNFRDLNGILSLTTIKRWCGMIDETGSINLRYSPGRPRTART
ncbi:unnamed protein product, partial [Rotaria magnacalcarata]